MLTDEKRVLINTNLNLHKEIVALQRFIEKQSGKLVLSRYI